MRRRHKGCRLLVPGHDEVDSGATQRFDDVEVFFPRNPKDPLDTLVLQGGDEQVRAFHGPDSSLGSMTGPRSCVRLFEPERPAASARGRSPCRRPYSTSALGFTILETLLATAYDSLARMRMNGRATTLEILPPRVFAACEICEAPWRGRSRPNLTAPCGRLSAYLDYTLCRVIIESCKFARNTVGSDLIPVSA
jgi:hypothetical protein